MGQLWYPAVRKGAWFCAQWCLSPNLSFGPGPYEIKSEFHEKRAESATFFIKTSLYLQHHRTVLFCHLVISFFKNTREDFSPTWKSTYQGHHPLINVRNVTGLKHGGLGTLEFNVLWIQYNFDGYQQKAPQLWSVLTGYHRW